jgi:hypothetical protein
MTTTTAAPNTTMSINAYWIKLILATLVAVILVIGVVTSGLMIAIYPAAIGYGGQQVPFWTGMLVVFLLIGFAGAAWLAASSKTKTWGGMIIILSLVLVTIGATIGGFYAFGQWDWTQFWFGAAELGLLAVAMGILYVYHKFV